MRLIHAANLIVHYYVTVGRNTTIGNIQWSPTQLFQLIHQQPPPCPAPLRPKQTRLPPSGGTSSPLQDVKQEKMTKSLAAEVPPTRPPTHHRSKSNHTQWLKCPYCKQLPCAFQDEIFNRTRYESVPGDTENHKRRKRFYELFRDNFGTKSQQEPTKSHSGLCPGCWQSVVSK
jgi:hypothetical protein